VGLGTLAFEFGSRTREKTQPPLRLSMWRFDTLIKRLPALGVCRHGCQSGWMVSQFRLDSTTAAIYRPMASGCRTDARDAGDCGKEGCLGGGYVLQKGWSASMADRPFRLEWVSSGFR